MRPWVAVSLAAAAGVLSAFAEPPAVPIEAGVRLVIAVSDSTTSADKDEGTVEGDYEVVVSITQVSAEAIAHAAFIDGVDARGVRRRGSIARVVTAADLANAPEQVLGFHSDDPGTVPGTTSLGPSLRLVRELVRTGAARYAFRNYVSRDTVSGTLRRSPERVRFPVLLNGARVELDAIHASGEMSLGGTSRPFDTVILDHPRFPLSLRIAYGPRNGAMPFTPVFTREIVRIDLPSPALSTAALDRECRVELRGIYFDFNRATLKPESSEALRAIAAALQGAPRQKFAIEGHTDDIGTDGYNQRLSAERAAAVKTALVKEFGIEAGTLVTAGHGERRPIEPNATLAGRARNRRVELVCVAAGS